MQHEYTTARLYLCSKQVDQHRPLNTCKNTHRESECVPIDQIDCYTFVCNFLYLITEESDASLLLTGVRYACVISVADSAQNLELLIIGKQFVQARYYRGHKRCDQCSKNYATVVHFFRCPGAVRITL